MRELLLLAADAQPVTMFSLSLPDTQREIPLCIIFLQPGCRQGQAFPPYFSYYALILNFALGYFSMELKFLGIRRTGSSTRLNIPGSGPEVSGILPAPLTSEALNRGLPANKTR